MRWSFTVLATIVLSTPIHATTIFESGSPEVINSDLGDSALVRNGTQVTVETGAVIAPQSFENGLSVEDTSSVIVNDGTITGFSGSSGIDFSSTGTFEFNGGSTTGSDSDFDAGNGITLSNAQTTTITGGEAIGGDGTGRFGSGGDGLTVFDGIVNISGGTLRGGNATSSFAGDGFVHFSSAKVTITDGTFAGGDGFIAGNALTFFDAVYDISGGVFTGGSGGVRDGWAISSSGSSANSLGQISGGTFNGIVSADAMNLNISGGLFNGPFRLTDSRLDVFGTGLSFENNILSGTLNDGTAINVTFDRFENSTVRLNPPAPVPLPAALPLVVAGLGALTLVGRVKAKTNTSATYPG